MAGRQGNGRRAKTALVNDEMERVRMELVDWRRHHKAPTAIPAELWGRAVELAKQNGLGPTARTLRLDYGSLKRRMESNAACPAPAEFLEWLAPVPAGIVECALEVESAHGPRLRVIMKHVTPSDLAALLRQFAG